jgi:cytochrome c oxidase subunit II
MDGSLPGYTPMKPTEGIGMPKPKEIDFQEQFSDNGQYAKWINNAILLPIITIISLFVLGLLLWVVVRFNRRANPVPSKTTHNTFIEIVWTLIPVLIVLGIHLSRPWRVRSRIQHAEKQGRRRTWRTFSHRK